MVHRRAVITGTVFGGALSAFGMNEAAAAQPAQQSSERQLENVAKAVQGVRDEIARQRSFSDIAAVREQTHIFLRANGRFPEFIEVGSDVWQQVYDWHVRFQQPISLGRTAEGRYTILLLATNVVMRPDLTPGYVGLGYDNR